MTRRRAKIWLISAATLLLLLALLPVAALLCSQSILCPEDPDPHGDIMVVLGGEFTHRAPRALKLFQAGAAPRILITGAGDCLPMRNYLTHRGVPSEAIQIEDASQNTRENAEYSARLLRQLNVKKAVLVTSWFHSRRALTCFRHFAPEIQFVMSPTIADRPASLWLSKYDRKMVCSEYFKLANYWLRYGVRPW